MTTKVLVVDDDPLTCELIHEVLSSAEIEACGVTDSRKAAALLQQEKFDAAFLDARMHTPTPICRPRKWTGCCAKGIHSICTCFMVEPTLVL